MKSELDMSQERMVFLGHSGLDFPDGYRTHMQR